MQPIKNLSSMSVAVLWANVKKELNITAESIYRTACYVEELSKRGVDVSELRQGLGVYYPLIANGLLLPEIAISLLEYKSMLTAVSRLQPAEQRKLIKQGFKVEVAGKAVSVEIMQLTKRELNVALDVDGGRIRSIKEQQALQHSKKNKQKKKTTVSKGYNVTFTAKQAEAVLFNAKATKKTVSQYIVHSLGEAGCFEKKAGWEI